MFALYVCTGVCAVQFTFVYIYGHMNSSQYHVKEIQHDNITIFMVHLSARRRYKSMK